ncbi:hypothetical protein [Paraburkholderia sp. BR14320]|uniref:hypothetical protein n=1 Tax=unclassified Paraburkholderia TaxID=2615204 RepID=UPI0034CD1966
MLTRSERAKIAQEFPEDIERMQKCLRNAGRSVTGSDVTLAWALYSDSLCASWLSLPGDDDSLTKILLAHLPDAGRATPGALCVALQETDEATGNFIVELPSDLVCRQGWEIGDTLSISEDPRGGLTLRRL